MLKLLVQVQTSVVAGADALRRNEDGQTMAEYGVVLAVIVIAVVGAMTLLSTSVSNALNAVAGLLPG